MRSLKFRAWDKKEKEMNLDVHKTHDWEWLPLDTCEDDVWAVMQYTGLTDKNGKEIYEFDLVKFTDSYNVERVGVIEWDKEFAGFGIQESGEDGGQDYCLDFSCHVEVIGNKFEVPAPYEAKA